MPDARCGYKQRVTHSQAAGFRKGFFLFGLRTAPHDRLAKKRRQERSKSRKMQADCKANMDLRKRKT
jgi:hypothetical protein